MSTVSANYPAYIFIVLFVLAMFLAVPWWARLGVWLDAQSARLGAENTELDQLRENIRQAMRENNAAAVRYHTARARAWFTRHGQRL